jgi:LytR cell envelope-related transcriptional attenuator
VEHPGLATDLVRPWRTAAVVASAVAAVELVVLLVLGVALLAKPVAAHVRKAAEERVFAPPKVAKAVKPKRRPVGAPRLRRGDIAVLVLNGNGRTGAAAVEADSVRAKGYRIAAVDDAPRRDYRRSLVMYRAGFAPEGQRLAKDLRIRVVGPLDGIGRRAMAGAHVVIVVGAR